MISSEAQQSQTKKTKEILCGQKIPRNTEVYANSQLPKKRCKRKQLNQSDREMNQRLERLRNVCEHIMGRLKVFKILAERY